MRVPPRLKRHKKEKEGRMLFLLIMKKGLKEGRTQQTLTRAKREKDILVLQLKMQKREKELEM